MNTGKIREFVTKAPLAIGKAVCAKCGYEDESLVLHLLADTCGTSLADYVETYPDAPLCTESGREQILRGLKKSEQEKEVFDIASTFGAKVFRSHKTVTGRKVPNGYTPPRINGYSFRPELLGVVLYAMEETGQNLYLYGPSGSGKTSIIEQACAMLNRGICRVNHDTDCGRSEIVGQWVLKGGDQMVFCEGLLPTAMREGHIYIADEFDFIDAGVAMVYQPILEGKPLVILETGDIIQPHPDFRFFATGNTFGQGDHTGLYNGARPMNEATMQRFSVFAFVDYPTQDEEMRILADMCGIADLTIRKKMVDVADLVRQSFKSSEITTVFSTRILVNIANKFLHFGSLRHAYAYSLLNRLNDVDKKVVDGFITRVWGRDYA